MPSKEIKELRQSGRLEEALTMAQVELEAQPENVWGKRNISWVYYEYLKKYAGEHNIDGFIDNLTNLRELNFPENEVMIFDTSAYQIGSIVFKLQNAEPIDYSKINKIFEIVKSCHFTKPSESYSLIYKAFHKGYNNWSRFIEFADWWDFNNFLPEDYQTTEFNNRQIMALVDQAYVAYSKKLLEGESMDSYGLTKQVDKTKIENFLPQLDIIINKYPEYQYPPYFKAKLLLELGNGNDVLAAFLPFAKQKKNDFWVWTLMAEIFKDDTEIQLACYCKALSLKTRNDFLVKSRQDFARLLIQGKLYNEAKCEIENIIAVRKQKEWKIPNEISQWMGCEWFEKAKAEPNNENFYAKNSQKAEEILYNDLPEHLVVVEFVNKERNILNFIKDKDLNGFFNYDDFLDKPQIGDLLNVRLEPIGNEGFYRLLTVNLTKTSSYSEVTSIKEISGLIRIPDGKSFGFVEDVFVPTDIISTYKLQNKDQFEGLALLSFNKKKNEWGWKLFKTIK
jgi:hypothetical protein